MAIPVSIKFPFEDELEIESWSLTEVVAWIMTRSWSAVEAATPSYWHRISGHGEPMDEPHSLRGDGAEVIRLKYRKAYSQLNGDCDAVADEIVDACKRGLLRSVGRYDSKSYIEILPADWENLGIIFGHHAQDDNAIPGPIDPYQYRRQWTDLRF